MTTQEFEQFVTAEPAVKRTVCAAGAEVPGPARGAIVEGALVVSMFPIVVFLIMHVGLPWAKTAASLSEALRERFERWLAGYCKRNKLTPPDMAFEKLQALVQRLQALTEGPAKEAWQRLEELLEREDTEANDGEAK